MPPNMPPRAQDEVAMTLAHFIVQVEVGLVCRIKPRLFEIVSSFYLLL
jgi:hypothetical protein